MMDDIDLLRRYAESGSEEAFAALVRRHLDLVYSAALRRVGDDIHLAKDVTQKVFVALARQAPAVAQRRTVTGWLYTASRYAAAHVVRTERRRKEREQRACIMNEIFSEGPSDVAWDRVRPELDAVMDRLNDTDREALLLRFFSGCAFSEVGRSLGLTEEAARKRVSRALDRLRGQLARRGVGSSAAAVAAMLSGHAVTAAPAGLAATVPAAAAAASAAPAGFSLLQSLGLANTGAGLGTMIAVATLITMPAIGFAVHEVRASRLAQASLEAATQDYAAEFHKLGALQRAERAAVPVLSRTVASDPGVNFLARFPEARAMLVEAGMSGAVRTNGLFYRLAGFTPAQINRFQQLLVESWADNLSLKAGGLAAGPMPSDEQLRAVVGEEAYQKFQAYNQMIDAYRWTGVAARELSFNDTPLSASQAAQLAQILANNSSLYRNGVSLNGSTVNDDAATESVDWDAALTQAQAVLSASQWKSLEPLFLNFKFSGALGRARRAQGVAVVGPENP